MRFSTLCSLLAIAGWTSASPLRARQAPEAAPSANGTDPGLLYTPQVLVTMLETGGLTFWQKLLDAFSDQDFEDAGFSPSLIRDRVITAIMRDESAHLDVLQSLLETPPVCEMDLSSALTDVSTALLTARQLDVIATGLYLGVIASEPSSNNLEIFSEIATNEGQHSLMLDLTVADQVTTHSFGLGLSANEIFTLISPFNVTCNPTLDIQANPALVITNNGTVTNTTTLTFDLSGTPCENQDGLFCQILNGDDATSTALPVDQCAMTGLAGANFIYITTDDTTLSADPVQRTNVSNLCAGPQIVLVDIA